MALSSRPFMLLKCNCRQRFTDEIFFHCVEQHGRRATPVNKNPRTEILHKLVLRQHLCRLALGRLELSCGESPADLAVHIRLPTLLTTTPERAGPGGQLKAPFLHISLYVLETLEEWVIFYSQSSRYPHLSAIFPSSLSGRSVPQKEHRPSLFPSFSVSLDIDA